MLVIPQRAGEKPGSILLWGSFYSMWSSLTLESKDSHCLWKTNCFLLLPQHFWQYMCMCGSSETKRFSRSMDANWVSCNSVQFWQWLPKISSNSAGYVLRPTDGSQFQMPMASDKFLGYPQQLYDLASDWRFLWPPFELLSFARVVHRTQGNKFISLFQIHCRGYRWTSR